MLLRLVLLQWEVEMSPPDLIGVTISPQQVDVSSSDEAVLFEARFQDESGLSGLPSIDLAPPSGQGEVGTSFVSLQVTSTEIIYRSQYVFSSASTPGQWSIRDIAAQDGAGNYAYFTTPDIAAEGYPTTVDVSGGSGTSDTVPPSLESLSFSSTVVDATAGPVTVELTAHVTDDLAGSEYLIAEFRGPSNQAIAGSAHTPAGGDRLDGTWVLPVTFAQFAEGGTWDLHRISLVDQASNVITLYTADLAAAGFPTEVEVTSEGDTVPPSLESLSFSSTVVDATAGPVTVELTAHVTDDLAGSEYLIAEFRGPSNQAIAGYAHTPAGGDRLDGTWVLPVTFAQFAEGGTWEPPRISLVDQASNVITLYTADLAAAGFPTEVDICNNGCPPQTSDDDATVEEDASVTIAVLENDADLNGTLDPSTVTIVDGPQEGDASVNADGTVTYAPRSDFNGEDAFTYTVADNDGLVSNEALVTITVTPVNDPPVAVNDEAETDEDTPVLIDVVANDTDADGDELVVVAVSDPEHGTAAVEDGIVTYTPAQDFFGEDTFTYVVSDGNGGTDEGAVTVTVLPVDDAPVALGDAYEVDEDETLTVAAPGVLANDYDVEGDPFSAAVEGAPEHATLDLSTDGSFTLTPQPDFHGTVTFTYRAVGAALSSEPATVTVEVAPVNDAPVAVDDAFVVDEDDPSVLDVLANDTDVDGDVLTIESVTQPEHGTVTIDDGVARQAQVAVRQADPEQDRAGTLPRSVQLAVSEPAAVVARGESGGPILLYTPEPDYNGPDTFTYVVSDGNGGTDEATVTLTVEAVNDAPLAVDDEAETEEDAPVTIDVLANDTDEEGDELTVVALGAPEHGTAEIEEDGTVTYTPSADFHGADAFTYTVADSNGGEAQASVTVTVAPVNDAPTASTITDPDDGAEVVVAGDPESVITAAWTASEDVDGDAVSYTWQASLTEGDFGDPAFSVDTEGLSTEITTGSLAAALDDAGVGVGESAVLYHRVVSTDGEASTEGPVAEVTLQRGVLTDAEGGATPAEFAIGGVYPNPTSERSTVAFDLAEGAEVTLEVYDLLGRLVLQYEAGSLPAGAGHGIDIPTSALGSGAYLYRLKAAGAEATEVGSGRLTVVR